MATEHFGAEADISTIFYVTDAANCSKHVIRVHSDDLDMFVLLVDWVYREEMECKVKMEWTDGTVQCGGYQRHLP